MRCKILRLYGGLVGRTNKQKNMSPKHDARKSTRESENNIFVCKKRTFYTMSQARVGFWAGNVSIRGTGIGNPLAVSYSASSAIENARKRPKKTRTYQYIQCFFNTYNAFLIHTMLFFSVLRKRCWRFRPAKHGNCESHDG